MEFDVIVVGHVAIDVNILPWGVIENALGGAPTYAGFALVALKRNAGIISKIGADFPEKFPPIYSKLGLDTEGMVVAGEHTTTFENTYDEDGHRTQVCTHVAAKLSPEDIPQSYRSARSFYISPIAGEVDPTMLEELKQNENVVMFDPQGILREIGPDGRVRVRSRDDLADFLEYVDVVKIGMDEAKVLKGGARGALEKLRELGPRAAILTQGPKPCAVLSDEGFEKISSLKVDARDLTGAGDVFGAAFLSRYLDVRGVLDSTRFASAAAGLKIRYKGPTGFPSEEEVLSAIR